MGDCSVEIRILISLLAFGVVLSFTAAFVAWRAALRILVAARTVSRSLPSGAARPPRGASGALSPGSKPRA